MYRYHVFTVYLFKSRIYPVDNSVDADQLASVKAADQDPHSFHSTCKNMQIIGVLLVIWI